jgi:hypothetical protein
MLATMLKKLTVKKTFIPLLLAILFSSPVWADIPATPVMTLYQFNGPLDMPYYTIESFLENGAKNPAGSLAQGTSIIPCLVIHDGKPLTDKSGTPYVGFEVVVDSRKATPASSEKFKETVAKRKSMTVKNHHCGKDVKYVISTKKMFKLEKEPFFQSKGHGHRKKVKELDGIVRAFHNSPQCEEANRKLIGRRDALIHAWERFIDQNDGRWSEQKLQHAKHLDFTMRTAIYEGHLDRSHDAYGACERNIIALSIRNRGREGCTAYQGCRFPGDFLGVSTKVSQYNIWDKYLTQISGLTSCFLRSDLEGHEYYGKIQNMYEQNVRNAEQILYANDRALKIIFPGTPLSDLKALRHYYHPPAMGKCFPNYPGVEYMSGAIAKKGNNFALIANTRIKVGKKIDDGYRFQEFKVKYEADKDVPSIVDSYPGFIVDARKVSLKTSSRCAPYGIPRGCKFKKINRYRKTPTWLKAGRPVEIKCKVGGKTVSVGGICDTQMKPIANVR